MRGIKSKQQGEMTLFAFFFPSASLLLPLFQHFHILLKGNHRYNLFQESDEDRKPVSVWLIMQHYSCLPGHLFYYFTEKPLT